MPEKKTLKSIIIFFLFLTPFFYPQQKDVTAINKIISQSALKESDPPEGFKLAEEAYKKAQSAGYKEGEAEALFFMGLYSKMMMDFERASNYYIASQKIFEEFKNPKKIGRNLMFLGDLYRAISEYELSTEYCRNAVRIFESGNFEIDAGKAYDRLAAVYYEVAFFNNTYIDSTKNAVKKSLEIARKYKDIITISSSMNINGALFIILKEYEKAIIYLNEALDFAIENNVENDIALIKLNIASANYYLGRYSEAIKYSKPVFEYASNKNILPYIDISSLNLYMSYREMNDFVNAFKYLEIYTNNRWILYDREKANQIRLLEKKYDSEKKEALINNQKEIEKLQTAIFSSLLLIAAIIIGAFFYRHKILKKKNSELEASHKLICVQNEKLKELNATKDKFFSIIGHDLKNPYQSLLGFSNILLEDYKELSEKEFKDYVGYIYEASDSGNRLLQNLLDWSRSETGRIQFQPENINLGSIILQSIKLLAGTAKQKDITLAWNSSMDPVVFCDKDMIYTVMRNLLSNAIKYSYRGSTVVIGSTVKEGSIEICIRDNGVGMSDDLIENLFSLDKNISHDGTENEKGTGLGLYLCKEFVERNEGKIWVESTSGKGSTFCFSLPSERA